MDRLGLWAESSLAQPEAIRAVMKFQAPQSAQSVVFNSDRPKSKYRQSDREVEWDGVVLACQKPEDSSVLSCAPEHTEDYYWGFVEKACRKHGKRLFLKLHPRVQNNSRVHEYASKFGCRVGDANHSVISKCKFVLLYNSSFAVDCWMRGVRVAQYAPGYFHRSGAVTYTDGVIPDSVGDTADMEQRWLDWLIWRYCFAEDMEPDRLLALFNCYASTPDTELFPMPEELSYAANVSYVGER
jgi:hypothetical protein